MIKRIALIYDDSYKWTTAFYCKRALEKLGYLVEHFLPEDVDAIQPAYDLYLNIDESKRYLIPGHLRPSAYWVIDTHIEYSWRLRKAKMFNCVFAADKNAVERLRKDGLRNVYWLPVACDPDMHRDYELPKEYDVAFIGHYHHCKDRMEYLNLLKKKLRNYRLFIGQAYGEEMSRIYSKSKIVFNRGIKGYLNMRIFEAMSCGGLLITDNLAEENGMKDLFGHPRNFITYHSKRDLIKKIKYYLCNDDARQNLAARGKDEVVRKHTYLHRMQELINIVETNKGALKNDDYLDDDISIFGSIHPKIFNLIGEKEKVLDIGCATGRFSKYLVSKKQCFVTGIEKDPLHAEKARRVLSQVIEGDGTSWETFNKINHKYDSVLLMDILEHVVNPESILLGIKKLLDKQSKIILTTPNIAYWAVRKKLLRGRFDYDSSGGLMDNEHVHFFTYYSLKEMIEDTGYKIKGFDIDYCFPLINYNHPFFRIIAKNIFMEKILHAIAKRFPNFFAHEFLFILEK